MYENKFNGKAEIYDKFRPSYSKNFFMYLYDKKIITRTSVIADIGSGTGIMGIEFAKEGNNVYVVEPNLDMIRIAKRNLLNYKNCFFKNTSAENTELGDNSIDLVVVAQAFHWFDKEKFKEECKRILKKNGNIVLVWNSTETNSTINIEVSNINKKLCPRFNSFSKRGEEDENEYSYFFRNGKCEFKLFKNDLSLNETDFIGRILSRTYSPDKNDPQYEEYINEMIKLFNNHAVKGKILIPNTTRAYIGKI